MANAATFTVCEAISQYGVLSHTFLPCYHQFTVLNYVFVVDFEPGQNESHC